MGNVNIREGCLEINGRRTPICSGEVHYWRLNPARWPEVLDRVREIGLDMVATYVPWQYHETAPGCFDFTGQTEPQRNLVGFLGLLRERSFHVFIRPGPFIYAEWVNAGVPDRVAHLPRLGEAYRREARTWMHAVTDVLRPFLATRGGPICLWQADNEMDLFSHWFEDLCGLDGTAPGFFQQFLRQAWPDLAALNQAWGTAYHSFDEAQAFAEPVDPAAPQALARRRDYWRFQHWAVREALAWHTEEYRRLGVDVPILANYYPGGDVQNWREVAKAAGVLGIDHYPRNEFAGDAEEHRRFLDSCRWQRTYSAIPMIAELECGVWHGYHDYVGVLSPNHYRLMLISAFLAGMKGFNWYMLVGRDNWYFCPINERAEWRPELAGVFKELHELARRCDPPALRKLTDVGVVLDPVHIGTERILADNPVLRALYDADLDFEVYDPETGRIEKPVLFYASADWLPRSTQERLREYVENGGTLVVFRAWPRRDELFQSYDALNIRPPDRVLSRLGKKVELSLGTAVGVSEGAVWCWDRPPGEPIYGTQVAGRQQAVENADKWMTRYIGRRWICGYREPKGRGAVIVVGLPPTADVVRGVVQWLGRPAHARAMLPGVKTGLFERDGAHFLFAVNLQPTDLYCPVALDALPPGRKWRVTDLLTDPAGGSSSAVVTTPSSGGAEIVVSLPRRCGGAWRIESVV